MSQDSRDIVWITGASTGIGRALALRYAKAGATVAASARGKEALEALAAEAETLPGVIHPAPLDVTDAEAVEACVEELEAGLGPIGQAVLNAGTHIPMGADDFDLKGLRTLVELNVMGTANCLTPMMSRMIARGGGRIAVVASLAGYCGLPSGAAYGLSKAGVINLCEALRPELEAKGVALQLVNPGFVRTPLTDKNDFPMPFLMELDDAAEAFYRGLGKDRFEIIFPRRFAYIMKLLRALPYGLLFLITRRLIPNK